MAEPIDHNGLRLARRLLRAYSCGGIPTPGLCAIARIARSDLKGTPRRAFMAWVADEVGPHPTAELFTVFAIYTHDLCR